MSDWQNYIQVINDLQRRLAGNKRLSRACKAEMREKLLKRQSLFCLGGLLWSSHTKGGWRLRRYPLSIASLLTVGVLVIYAQMLWITCAVKYVKVEGRKMIKKPLIKTLLDLLRWSVRGIMLVTAIFVSLFICWFVYQFCTYLKDWCEHTIFDGCWWR